MFSLKERAPELNAKAENSFRLRLASEATRGDRAPDSISCTGSRDSIGEYKG